MIAHISAHTVDGEASYPGYARVPAVMTRCDAGWENESDISFPDATGGDCEITRIGVHGDDGALLFIGPVLPIILIESGVSIRVRAGGITMPAEVAHG